MVYLVKDTGNGELEEHVLKKFAVKIEEEVLDKRGAKRGRGEPWEWRMVRKVKKCQPRKR